MALVNVAEIADKKDVCFTTLETLKFTPPDEQPLDRYLEIAEIPTLTSCPNVSVPMLNRSGSVIDSVMWTMLETTVKSILATS